MRTPGTGLFLRRNESRVSGARGGRARASHHRWHVEGEALTTAEIAARLGISMNAAQKRVLRIRTHGNPITWSALRLEKP